MSRATKAVDKAKVAIRAVCPTGSGRYGSDGNKSTALVTLLKKGGQVITPKYEYSFGIKNLPVGQIVNVARRDISIPDQPWQKVGSYFSLKKRVPERSAYNPGPNWFYERERSQH